jgi:hypothetical protein
MTREPVHNIDTDVVLSREDFETAIEASFPGSYSPVTRRTTATMPTYCTGPPAVALRSAPTEE